MENKRNKKNDLAIYLELEESNNLYTIIDAYCRTHKNNLETGVLLTFVEKGTNLMRMIRRHDKQIERFTLKRFEVQALQYALDFWCAHKGANAMILNLNAEIEKYLFDTKV